MKRSRGRGRRPQNGGGGGGGGGGGSGGHHHNHNRSFDSTGPDVKIRGTATHVYEKYLQLARDAGSSGDRVTAENYLQHAEHYYRILMAQGAQMNQAGQQPQQQPNYAGGQPQPNGNGNVDGQLQQPGNEGFTPPPGSTPSFSLADSEEAEEEDEVT